MRGHSNRDFFSVNENIMPMSNNSLSSNQKSQFVISRFQIITFDIPGLTLFSAQYCRDRTSQSSWFAAWSDGRDD